MRTRRGPGGSQISASSFLALRGPWGKAGGCETELSPNPPGGGEPVSWRRPRSWGQKNNFKGSPSAPPFPRHTPGHRSADVRMVPAVGIQGTHGVRGHHRRKPQLLISVCCHFQPNFPPVYARGLQAPTIRFIIQARLFLPPAFARLSLLSEIPIAMIFC